MMGIAEEPVAGKTEPAAKTLDAAATPALVN